ncbi:LysR family transcriptional regulator [Cognatishimia sp. F0-27]|uniref:LysR family transcriptional regulator n=1 Tax=Cognatishimia sp. F0-27 TaxID=2816855 RepID=UPI001D0C52BA|nr:LysR family transcriptional regulator [Cognatishimia sp. F0-27]MCC1495115.1 LysR family transcriptional regulator [Cognatishimia sp. F0-27]
MRNLDITTLRSFLAVAESGGVTRAAGFLNLTQSAVSMQIKRLEEQLDLTLLDRSGRGVRLTPSGALLLSYAERMVGLNDEIYARLTDQTWEGRVALGVPYDIVYPVIPQVLRRMGREHPRVQVDMNSSSTIKLKEQFARGEVDLILTTETGCDTGGETLTEVPLRWVGAINGQAAQGRPLRLGFCSFCAFAERARMALDRAGLPWEMALESDNDRTVEATVSADLAVTATLEGHHPNQLEPIDARLGLPDLGIQRINMYQGTGRGPLVGAMADYLRQGFAGLPALSVA